MIRHPYFARASATYLQSDLEDGLSVRKALTSTIGTLIEAQLKRSFWEILLSIVVLNINVVGNLCIRSYFILLYINPKEERKE